jgi:exoribonuclease-2
MIMVMHDLPLVLLLQALLQDPPPPEHHTMKRLDLTHMAVYTIDDASTEEVDDGLSVERLESGETRIWLVQSSWCRF